MHYYAEDGSIFVSKHEALDYCEKNNQIVKFYYHDDVFSSVDWTYDPVEALNTLYKEQARRIRDEYEYVILCYSGGYDSTNILEVFHYNNIKLDKIVITGPFSQDNGIITDVNHNGEIYRNALPYVKELGLENITQLVDYSELYKDPANFSIFEYDDNWYEHIGTRYSPHNWFWRDLDRHVVPKEHQNKKIAVIWGTDKPTMSYKHNPETLYFYFRDTALTSYARINQPFRHNVSNINFYWDPEFPKILQKQNSLIKNLYLRSKITFANLSTNDIVKLVYDLKKPLIFKSNKSTSLLFSKRDNFIHKHKNSDIYKFFMNGIDRIKDKKEQVVHTKTYTVYNGNKK